MSSARTQEPWEGPIYNGDEWIWPQGPSVLYHIIGTKAALKGVRTNVDTWLDCGGNRQFSDVRTTPKPCLMVSLRLNALHAVAEHATFVTVVMEFGAVRADAAAHPQKEFSCGQHTQKRGQEIDPKRMPTSVSKCRAKAPRGIHAHSGERRFKRDKDRVKCADKIGRVPRE